MAEYISRDDVLKKAKSSILVPADNEWDCGYNTAMAEMKEFIKQLPATALQPVKRSKWKYGVCWNCYTAPDYFVSGDYWVDSKPDFCPNCGADMRGDEND